MLGNEDTLTSANFRHLKELSGEILLCLGFVLKYPLDRNQDKLEYSRRILAASIDSES